VLFHYALVDDLITKEEFEQRVERKIDECGDLIDEPTAAMLVVGELGRQHVKIQDLSGRSSLFSFFGKVVDKTEPREFDRSDGEKRWVASLLLGDETGIARVVLWDEKAGATLEIAPGEVLEVIGRHPGKGGREIYALALRKAICEIAYDPKTNKIPSLSVEPVTLEVVLLGTEPLRTFMRRDGSTGEMVEAVVGDSEGTIRLVSWAPELISEIPPGTAVRITNAKPNDRDDCRAYSIDEKSIVTVSGEPITVPFTPLAAVSDRGFYSVQSAIKYVNEPRAFTSRDGSQSWVRNLTLSDESDEINVVLWGEKALTSLHPGDRITLYHAGAKPGRSGGIELGAGRGSVLALPEEVPHDVTICGTIIAGIGCTFIDDGRDRYLVDGDFTHGSIVRITGMLSGNRIVPVQSETVECTTSDVMARIARLREQIDAT
jgi:replication factor A1